MKLFSFTIWLFVNFFSYGQESINGTWVSKEDKKSIITFSENIFFDIYNNDTLDIGTFERSIYTCDSSYIDPTVKADFILLKEGDDQTCYEITGISDSVLSYRYTTTGRLHVFTKEKK